LVFVTQKPHKIYFLCNSVYINLEPSGYGVQVPLALSMNTLKDGTAPCMLWPYTPSVNGTGLQQWSTLLHTDSSPSDWQCVPVMWIIVRGDRWFIRQYKGENFGVGSLHYKDWWEDAQMCDRYEVTVCVYICLAGDIMFLTCSYSYNPKTMKKWKVLLLC